MADIMKADYLTKLKAEIEGRLGCGIEVVEASSKRSSVIFSPERMRLPDLCPAHLR